MRRQRRHDQRGKHQKNADQLQKIYVLRSFLGHGVGAALMQPIIGAARQRASFLWLDVLRENTRAIEFYERFGATAEDEGDEDEGDEEA